MLVTEKLVHVEKKDWKWHRCMELLTIPNLLELSKRLAVWEFKKKMHENIVTSFRKVATDYEKWNRTLSRKNKNSREKTLNIPMYREWWTIYEETIVPVRILSPIYDYRTLFFWRRICILVLLSLCVSQSESKLSPMIVPHYLVLLLIVDIIPIFL